MTADRDALIAQVRTLQERWRKWITGPYRKSISAEKAVLRCADELGELIDEPRRQEPEQK